MLIFRPLKSSDWQKNNVAVNNSKQLVSHGEALGRTSHHTAMLCNFMDAHQSTVRVSQRAPQSKCFPFGFSQNNRLKEQRKADYFPANRHVGLQEGGLYNRRVIFHKARMNLVSRVLPVCWAGFVSLSSVLVFSMQLPCHIC